MSYSTIEMREEFHIDSIATIHHFEYKSDYIYKSEYHDFRTIFYVEHGSLELSASGKKALGICLEEGHLYLQAANEPYSFRSCGEEAALVYMIGFYSQDVSLDLLSGKDLTCDDKLKSILRSISEESRRCFTSRIDSSSIYHLERRFDQPFGGEQLILLYLKTLLIYLMRMPGILDQNEPIYDSESLKRDILLYNRITNYYMEHITEHLKVETVCQEFSIGRSHLQRVFRKQTGMGAMEYFCQMRISVARQYIRDQDMSLTETSKALGYSSVHYFSKQFKKITGMTPSEYKNSILQAQNDPIYQHIHK